MSASDNDAPPTVQLQRSTVIGDPHFITCLSSLLRMSYLKMLYWVKTIDRLHTLQLVCIKEADHSTEDRPIVRPGYLLRYARMSRNRWRHSPASIAAAGTRSEVLGSA